jgi:hypothetical protein
MNAIKISVNKQMDGYTFSILPSIRSFIQEKFPNAHPANNIFVGYDNKTDFEGNIGRLENYIYPVLLGVDSKDDLKKLGEIQYIDVQTGAVIFKIIHHD